MHRRRAWPQHQARNSSMLVQCFYALDDFAGLVKLADVLPEGSPLLADIGAKLQGVGLCSDAVGAFLKVCCAAGGMRVLVPRPHQHATRCWHGWHGWLALRVWPG